MICLSWVLMGIFLKCLLCEGSCRESNHVVGVEGGDLLLQVDPVAVLGDITWFSSGNHFATSESGKNLKIRDHRYKGKVYSMEDGSLLMKNLTRADQGTYIGSTLKTTSGKPELCALIYELQVYEMLSEDDIEIEYEVSSNETCNVTVSCSVRGSNVTITWERSTGNDLNVTNSVVSLQDPDPEVVYTCTARNPLTNTSKSVTPWEYCKQGTEQDPEDYTALNLIRLSLAGCILTITGLIFGHHVKTEVMASASDNG